MAPINMGTTLGLSNDIATRQISGIFGDHDNRVRNGSENRELTQMNANDMNIKQNVNHSGQSGNCAHAVQTAAPTKIKIGPLRRLFGFLASCLEAHHNRVAALRVYPQDRLDGTPGVLPQNAGTASK